MPKLLIVIPNADLRGRQMSLWEQAKKHDIVPKDVKPGDIIAFLNSDRDKVAVLAVTGETDSEGVMGYYKSPHGRIEPHALKFIPECFGAEGLDMTKATAKALDEILPPKRKRKET